MENAWDEVRKAVDQATAINRACDGQATEMAGLLVGRLQHVKTFRGVEYLRKLKKELRDFDMVRGVWK